MRETSKPRETHKLTDCILRITNKPRIPQNTATQYHYIVRTAYTPTLATSYDTG